MAASCGLIFAQLHFGRSRWNSPDSPAEPEAEAAVRARQDVQPELKTQPSLSHRHASAPRANLPDQSRLLRHPVVLSVLHFVLQIHLNRQCDWNASDGYHTDDMIYF